MDLEKLDQGKQFKICVELENVDAIREKSTVNTRSIMTLLVANDSNEILLYEKYAHSYMTDHVTLNKLINVNPETTNEVNAHFISEDWVGIDCNCKEGFGTSSGNKSTEKKVKKSYKQKQERWSNLHTNVLGYVYENEKESHDGSVASIYPIYRDPVPRKTAVKKNKVESSSVEKETTGTSTGASITDSTGLEKEQESDNARDLNVLDKKKTDVKETEIEALNNSEESLFSDIFDKHMSEIESAIENEMCKISEKEATVVLDDGNGTKEEKDVGDEEIPYASNLTDIEERVNKAPSLFSISKKYGESISTCGADGGEVDKACRASYMTPFSVEGRKKRNTGDVKDPMEFETSLYIMHVEHLPRALK
ncbi:hypothetical protein NQ315_001622 [Exocentrus adspersus]|uniref:Uncharacterized protein n=1 Tax=Exocentrus adspersus TaxID=1586481 RepID=A0AAV8WA29_9CUCU|nr:hypothetical protein NQ315_001622 [Exocentrus adspersus]